MMLYQIFKVLLIILLLHIYSIVYAEIHINITKELNKLQLISVIPFKNNIKNPLNNNIADIISDDLLHSGKFRSLSTAEFPEEINNISDISIEKWLNLGTNILVLGKVSETNTKEYIIFYQLIDISNHLKTIILQNQYTVTYQWIRYAAHSIGNDIFEKLTGIRGAFCTRIAYIVHTVNNKEYPYKLYIADYDGCNEILIHRSKEPLMSPSWAPSGNQLVYVTFGNYRSMLVMHDLKSGVIQQLISFPRHNGAPSFSPNGKKLAFVLSKTGSLNLYVIDLITNEIQQITNERSNNTEPSWFPDNKTLVYTSDRSGTPQIYKINSTDINSISERLSWSNFHNQNGKVSSDGKFLIMISKIGNSQNITKLDFLTKKCYQLTHGILDETPTLSPNDSMIIYNTFEGSQSKLYLISIDGYYKVCLQIHHKEIRFPTWSPYIE